MVCRVCRGVTGIEHRAREMMLGTREVFLYWQCSKCGCLQIVEVPERLGDYYPKDYYSFSLQAPAWKKLLYRAYFKAPRLMEIVRPCPPAFASVMAAELPRGARIMDVGCGSGKLVAVLRSVGFDAHGTDPFVSADNPYVRQAPLEEAEGGWDLIMFHHSLEHIPDNVAALRCARNRLGAHGTCIVRIPLALWAWSEFGTDWVQLDAPRHLILHTLDSFKLTAELAGLQISKVIFDSVDFQITGSKLYQRDIALNELENGKRYFSDAELKSYRKRAAELNSQQLGDQAAFLLKPTIQPREW